MNEHKGPAEFSAHGQAEPYRHYSAFISYTHEDRAKVQRLQARLEGFCFPRELARKLGYSRLKPVCVDRSEMRAAPDLGDAIKDSLDRSDWLIVACTPNVPASHWMGREIEYFRSIRGDERILVAVLDGEAPHCFHPQLLKGTGEDHKEPLAADFTSRGDGYRLALLKIIASLASVDLDELVLRHKRQQRINRLSIAAASLAVAAAIAFFAYSAYRSDIAADKERIFASEAMQRQLEELRQEVRDGGTLNMAAAINRNVEQFYEAQPSDSGVPEVELGRAQLLHAKTETDISRRDFAAAQENARKAWLATAGLHKREPKNLDITFGHAQSAFWLAYTAWLQRDTPLAAAFFARYAQLADELVAAKPDNSDFVLEQGYAYSNLGMIALREARDLKVAERDFKLSQAAFRKVVQRNPADTDTIFAIADGDAWLADVALFGGDYRAAQQYRDKQLQAIERLLKDKPQSRFYRLGYLASRIGQARLDAAQGNHNKALEMLGLADRDATELLAGDPQNPSLVERLRIIKLFQAKSELELGSAAALRRAEQHIGDCGNDWQVSPNGELPVFCTLLEAALDHRKGKLAAVRELMADPRLVPWIKSPSLSPIWRLDLQDECRNIGMPSLCAVRSR